MSLLVKTLTALLTVIILTLPVVAQPKIKIDLSTSGLTDRQKELVIRRVQDEYDEVDPDNPRYQVSEGVGGVNDIKVKVEGGGIKNGEWGKTPGKPGGVSKVWAGTFRKNGFTGDNLADAIGETAAHEAGHQLGLDHNKDQPPSKMTHGELVDIPTRMNKFRSFNENDKQKLQQNFHNMSSEQNAEGIEGGRLNIFLGRDLLPPESQKEELTFDTLASWLGPSGSEFGLLSYTDEFVFEGDTLNTLDNPSPIAFVYASAQEMLMRIGTDVYLASSGDILLSNPNPFNSRVYRFAQIGFDSDGDAIADSFLTLDSLDNPYSSTAGFTLTPEPGSGLLLLLGLALLVYSRLTARNVLA